MFPFLPPPPITDMFFEDSRFVAEREEKRRREGEIRKKREGEVQRK